MKQKTQKSTLQPEDQNGSVASNTGIQEQTDPHTAVPDEKSSEQETDSASAADWRLHYVYILVCRDGSYYTGYTTDLSARLKAHQRQKGARYTKSRCPVWMVYHEAYLDKHSAMSREYVIKQLTRTQKEELILHGSAIPVGIQKAFASQAGLEKAGAPEKASKKAKTKAKTAGKQKRF